MLVSSAVRLRRRPAWVVSGGGMGSIAVDLGALKGYMRHEKRPSRVRLRPRGLAAPLPLDAQTTRSAPQDARAERLRSSAKAGRGHTTKLHKNGVECLAWHEWRVAA